MATCESVAERLKELKQEDLDYIARFVNMIIDAYLPVITEEDARELAAAYEEYQRGEYMDAKDFLKELEALP